MPKNNKQISKNKKSKQNTKPKTIIQTNKKSKQQTNQQSTNKKARNT